MTPSPIQATLLIALPFSHGPARRGAHKGYSKKQMAGTSLAMRQLSDLAEGAAQAIEQAVAEDQGLFGPRPLVLVA